MIFQPAFFDIFGSGAFFFIVILSIWALKTKKPLPKWTAILLLAIGISGLLVDGVIVYTTYLK